MIFKKQGGLFHGQHRIACAIFIIVLTQAVVAKVIGSMYFGSHWTDVFSLIRNPRTMQIWLLIPLIWLGIVTIEIARRKIDKPTKTLIRWVRYRFDWIMRGLLIVLAYPTMATSFSIIKESIPNLVGFYADPLFLKADVFLFGQDAWSYLFSVLPHDFIFFVDRIYILWFSYLALMTGVFSFTRDIKFQMRAALTFFSCWVVLGIFAAFALASVGPVFYDRVYGGDHFKALLEMLSSADQEQGLVAKLSVNFLLTNAGTSKLGVGISAMPSLHVSMAFLGFLMSMHYERKIWLKLFTAAFTVLIMIGSVLLGWHYFVDGVVAVAGTWLIWFASGKAVDWEDRRSQRGRS